MAKFESNYDIYLTFFGTIKSGTKINPTDYFHRAGGAMGGAVPFTTAERASVSLAVQDVSSNSEMKSKAKFEAEIKKLMEE